MTGGDLLEAVGDLLEAVGDPGEQVGDPGDLVLSPEDEASGLSLSVGGGARLTRYYGEKIL